MANITPTITRVMGRDGLDGYAVVWANMGNADTGLAVGSPVGDGGAVVNAAGSSQPGISGCVDRSFGVTGTLGGATVTIEGSNDGTNFQTLITPATSGTVPFIPSTTTTAAMLPVNVPVVQIRPRTSGGTTTALTVTAFLRNPNPK